MYATSECQLTPHGPPRLLTWSQSSSSQKLLLQRSKTCKIHPRGMNSVFKTPQELLSSWLLIFFGSFIKVEVSVSYLYNTQIKIEMHKTAKDVASQLYNAIILWASKICCISRSLGPTWSWVKFRSHARDVVEPPLSPHTLVHMTSTHKTSDILTAGDWIFVYRLVSIHFLCKLALAVCKDIAILTY